MKFNYLKLGGFYIDQIEKLELNILKTEEKIEELQVKLQEYKDKKNELDNKKKLKILTSNNIDSKQLEMALKLLFSQNNTIEKENEFENK